MTGAPSPWLESKRLALQLLGEVSPNYAAEMGDGFSFARIKGSGCITPPTPNALKAIQRCWKPDWQIVAVPALGGAMLGSAQLHLARHGCPGKCAV